MDLNQFMHDVHQNAKAHGWWDEPRSVATIRALFHCELSEAMEAYRGGEANHWHVCPNHIGKACEDMDVHNEDVHCEACSASVRKPEGVCVELMDFVIRVMDYLGSVFFILPVSMDTVAKMRDYALQVFQHEEVEDPVELELPDLVDILHTQIALSDVVHDVTYLITACGLAFAWAEKQGLDPAYLLKEKHEYNVTRSYKHGGKVC